ncbi:hypothetical protein [Streptococcus ovuberis]|uniref:Uncharacterized protein n=1 Tax=Streptococcus ovuberis TaxID=1936207 RepID=A0A7X6RZZ8_9STRE|nr:hypothetical protein [Streptococcus ovuberis]NKZ19579.1 hypothetical protein [Streptococcus ovuberis]
MTLGNLVDLAYLLQLLIFIGVVALVVFFVRSIKKIIALLEEIASKL